MAEVVISALTCAFKRADIAKSTQADSAIEQMTQLSKNSKNSQNFLHIYVHAGFFSCPYVPRSVPRILVKEHVRASNDG